MSEHNRRCRRRAIEQRDAGHPQPIMDNERHVMLVASRSRPEVYDVTLRLVGRHIIGTCTCQAGRASMPLGELACWHEAAVALAMEAAELLFWEEPQGHWHAGRLAPEPEPPPVGPIGGTLTADEHRRALQANPPKPGSPEHDAVIRGLVD